MVSGTNSENPKRVPFLREWKFWIAIVATILSIVTTLIAVDQHLSAKAEAASRLEAEAAASAARAAQQQAEQRTKELEAEQDSMRKFLINYAAHLTEIRSALSRFKEVQTESAEEDVWASISSFIDFVEKWRRVQPILGALLNGTVNELRAAAGTKDKDKVSALSRQLEKSLSDQGLLLEKEIENLKRKLP